MMKKKLYADYILMQLLYFVLMGTLISYGSYALLQLGYSASMAGIIMAIGSLLSAILQPIAANISDNSKRFSLFNVCIIISIICVLLSTATFVQRSASLLMTLSFIGITGTFTVLEPLINTVPAILKNNGIELNYGVGRAVGSLGYALANALLGILTGKFPYYVVFLCAIIASILLLLINIKANKDFLTISTVVEKQEEKESISYSQFLKRHKSFVVLMLCTTGIYLGFTMTDNMMILVVNNVGGNSSDLGMIMAFKACLEVPVIFFYDKLEKLSSPEKLLKVAAISFVLKAAILCFAKSVSMIYVAQLVQLSSLSLEIPAMVSYITKIMDKKEAVRGQALYITGITVASVLSSLVSGIISDIFSTNMMLIVAFSITTASVIAYLLVIDKTK